jgi:prepilin-type N-terminal cleavage/methylation domain-containing protein
MMSKKWQADNGFTAIEAIMVVIIIGILATTLIYRFSPSQSAGLTVASDQVISDIQYLQALAMGIGAKQSISFTVSSDVYSLQGKQKKLPDGITVTGTTLPGNTLTFNTLGEPMFFDNSDRAITLAGSRTLKIYAITGKVE